MKILIGGCVRQVPDVLKAHLQTLRWQAGKYDIDYAFINDNTFPESAAMLAEMNPVFMLDADPKPADAVYGVNDVTHHWSLPMFGWLGAQKQKILDYARTERYDAVLLVDSDLLLSPDTLDSLWNTRKDVVSGVFWTKWSPDQPPLPQVWLRHPYELSGMGIEQHEFLGSLAGRKLVRVGGLGACTLIRAAVLDRVRYFPLLDGLPMAGMWQGEDRHFAVGAQRNQVEMWADAWPDIWHCYRPDDRSQIGNMLAEVAARALPPVGHSPAVGDLVSFSLEPLEEPKLAGYQEHMRGRMGAIKMLPQIEDELSTMRAGDERIVRLRFPMWYEVEPYRGRTKLVRLKLFHCKPFGFHPSLVENTQTIARAA